MVSDLTHYLTKGRFFLLLEMQSVVKQNLHLETEADINKLINIKLTASYTYLALVLFVLSCVAVFLQLPPNAIITHHSYTPFCHVCIKSVSL